MSGTERELTKQVAIHKLKWLARWFSAKTIPALNSVSFFQFDTIHVLHWVLRHVGHVCKRMVLLLKRVFVFVFLADSIKHDLYVCWKVFQILLKIIMQLDSNVNLFFINMQCNAYKSNLHLRYIKSTSQVSAGKSKLHIR